MLIAMGHAQMYSQAMAVGYETLAANKRVRTQAAELRDDAKGLRLRYRRMRFF